MRRPHWLGGSPPGASSSLDDERKSLSRWLAFLYLVPLAGVAGMLVYAVAGNATGRVFGVSLLWAASAWVFGAFLGFLFAIPQSASRGAANGTSPAAAYKSNSNLEEISDWLTKILVGIGLVQLGNLTDSIKGLIDFISPSLARGTGSDGYVLALLILFSISGFLSVYIVTRTNISVLFAQTEKMLQETVTLQASAAAAAATQKDATTEAGAPDAEPAVETTVSMAATVAGVDPGAAAALAGARIIESIQTLYTLIYSRPASDIDQAIGELSADRYMDAELAGIARQLLGLTRDAGKIGAFTAGAAANVADATDKFLRSLSRTASLNFEQKVEDSLAAVPGVHDVKRHPTAKGREADFVATIDGRVLVVESYLPPRPQPRYLIRRIEDRLKTAQAFQAAELVVVLPDGIATDVTNVPRKDNVTVTTIGKLADAISAS
jgi:hypothetical protein